MVEVNLLPSELAPKKSIVDIAKKLKKISTVGFIVFVVYVLSTVGILFIFSNRLNKLVQEENELKTSIKALEQTEQRLVLIKDRLDKASYAYSLPSSWGNLFDFKALVSEFPEGISWDKVSIKPKDLEFSVTTPNSISMSRLIEGLVKNELYTKVVLKGLNYDSFSGKFQMSFELSK